MPRSALESCPLAPALRAPGREPLSGMQHIQMRNSTTHAPTPPRPLARATCGARVSSRWRVPQGPGPVLVQPSGRKDHGFGTLIGVGQPRLDQDASLCEKELFSRRPLHSGPGPRSTFRNAANSDGKQHNSQTRPCLAKPLSPRAPLAPRPHLVGTRCLVKNLRGG